MKVAFQGVLMAAVFGAAGLAATVQGAAFNDVTMGQAGPSGLNLGIFVTGPTSINASNSGTSFQTNMGLANGASTNFSGNGTLTGKLYADPGATLQPNLATQFNINGGTVRQSLTQPVSDVQTAASKAASLIASQVFGAVGGSALTINPTTTGPVNALGGHDTVVSMSSISIANPSDDLTIHGGAGDFYIINVLGDISVTNGAITATGGIDASHILFNVEGTGNSVALSNSTSFLTGTYLAPNANQKITLSPGSVDGGVIGYQLQTSSGPTVIGDLYNPYGSVVPEPASLGLLGLAGVALLTRRRRVRPPCPTRRF